MEDAAEQEIELVWLLNTLKDLFQTGQYIEGLQSLDSNVASGRPQGIPPEELAYLRNLFKYLHDGRDIVFAYNYALLALLAVLMTVHVLERRRCQKRWLDRTRRADAGVISVEDNEGLDHGISGASSSSGTSNSPQITTPSGAAKDIQVDTERLPLLGLRQAEEGACVFKRLALRLKFWSEYQPRPLPVVKKVLPSNGTSLFVIFWFLMNIFFLFYRLPFEPKYFFCVAARAGDLFIVNLPLLYLLAAKNQPLKILTGRSYEALNIFHRRVGEWMCFEAFVHSAGMVMWRFALEPRWLHRDLSAWAYFTHPLIYYGLGAFISYEMLYFTSLGSFRQRWYEIFLASHVVLQILALGFLYRHFPRMVRPYVLASLAIFLVDRIIWRLGLKSATMAAELRVLPDGETMLLSADWEKPSRASRWRLWPRQNIRYGWKPTDHVFVTVPVLGRKHALQSHPFTIASEAPSTDTSHTGEDLGNSTTHTTDVSLKLLIRAHDGFTADLLCYAQRHRTVSVRLDGPYGSSHALDMLRAADNAVLVAGGSGIAVTFPLAAYLLQDRRGRSSRSGQYENHIYASGEVKQRGRNTPLDTRQGRRQTVRMIWIIHSEEHRQWMPKEQLDGLVEAGLELLIPPPTSVAGRPDVADMIRRWVDDSWECGQHDRQTAVVVSGPDGLNRVARNTCAEALKEGADVRLAVEKFGW